jgi:tetratricopeptide (TPR) repeat protein
VDPEYYRERFAIQRIWSPIPDMASTCQVVSTSMIGVNFDPELYGLAGALCHQAGEASRAGSYLSQSLQDDPGQWSGLLYSALEARDQGDLAKAERLTETLTSEHRDVGAFYLVQGEVAQARGKIDEAISAYGTALRYDRSLVRAHVQLGGIYIDREQQSEAKQELTAATMTDDAYLEPRLMMFESGIL